MRVADPELCFGVALAAVLVALVTGCGLTLDFGPRRGDPEIDAGKTDGGIRTDRCSRWGEFGAPHALDELNTTGSEFSPSMTRDRLEILFAGVRDGNEGFDLWLARRGSTREPFGPPERIESLDGGDEHDPEISPDGLLVFFTPEGGGVLRAERRNRDRLDFAPPEAIQVLSGGTLFEFGAADVSPDESTMYLSVGTQGRPPHDLFVARRTERGVYSAVGLAEFTTPAHEGWPSVSTDGLELFFDRGEGDIWRVERSSTSEEFSIARAELLSINDPMSVDQDADISPDGTTLCFDSLRFGSPDIFCAERICIAP